MQRTFGANQIREYIQAQYFEPARKRRETLVTLRAGDIHKELGLRNRVPNVCQVMESRLLEKEAGVRISSKQGPPSGRGTTLTVTYEVRLNNETEAESKETPGPSPAERTWVRLFYEMRGMGKDVFAAEGGGESFLNRERDEFYGPGKKELE